MPRSGPAPTPTALKLARGNPGHRPLNKEEPKPRIEARCPAAPSWLDAYAKHVWKRMAPELHKRGLLSSIDHHAFACYCQAVSDFKRALEELRKSPAVVVLDNGYQVQSPWVSIRRQAMEQIKKYAIEFGMTPSARCHLPPVEPEGDEDREKRELEAAIFGKKEA